MLDADSGEWLTYQQAAQRLGLASPEAARSLARRQGWSRQTPNEIGAAARVRVPTGFARRSRPDPTGTTTDADRRSTALRPSSDRAGDSFDDAPIDQVVDRSVALAVEVAMLRERIDDKDSVIEDLRQRVDRAEAAERIARDEAAKLWVEVVEQRVAKRMAERAAAEAVELRQRLDDAVAAERLVRDETAGLRNELDARREWGLTRRLGWALRRR